jgi:hypothetical protein
LGASGGEISSAYTDLNLDACKIVSQSEGEGSWTNWECRGLNGIPVRVSEDDLRFSVSYGNDAETACSAQQTFGHFNSLGPRIEWRLENGKPFATILRWNETLEDETVSWLTVSKFDGVHSCFVALIDPKTQDANGAARQKADELARAFRCERDEPQVISPRMIKASELISGWPCPVE